MRRWLDLDELNFGLSLPKERAGFRPSRDVGAIRRPKFLKMHAEDPSE
jgi:hypothetical protein